MNKFFIGLGFLCLLFLGSCNYLDVVPDERPTEKDAFRDVFAARNFLYSCYSYIPAPRRSPGSLDFMTADEVITPFEHESFAWFPKGQFTASNPVISYWEILYKGIRQCYLLIDNVDTTPGLDEDIKQLYKAEATFLIGYYHFLLARMYGPIIIQSQLPDIEVNPNNYPARSSYDAVVDFIVSKYDEAAAGLPEKFESGSDFGRVTSVIARAMKSRVLLYAASPLFNGGGGLAPSFYADFKDKDGNPLISTAFDREKWKRAADAAREAIEAAENAGIELYRNSTTTSLQPTDPIERDLRYVFADRNTKELIWADTRAETAYDLQNKSTPFYLGNAWNGVGPTLRMVETFYTRNGLPIDKDPAFNYAGRYNIGTSELGPTMELNLNREPRFNAWIAYHNSKYEIIRPRVNFIVAQFRKNDNCGIGARTTSYTPTGYLNKKGVHPLLNQDNGGVSQQYSWPVIRLAELYLNYAESLIEYGEDFATAKTYIDKVRTRAGIPTVDESWAPIGGANDQATLRDIIRQERTIELYLENHRFWDVRRWMQGEKYFDAPPQGMNIYGETDEDFFRVVTVKAQRRFRSPAFYLMPIPIDEVNKNMNLIQNPGY